MPRCAVRSCNKAPVIGFEERIEISSFIHPHRTIPVGTRYWCSEHQGLADEVPGKLGRAINMQKADIETRL